MGFRFSIAHANWLAHILQPVGATPRLEHTFEEERTLQTFIESFRTNFLASRSESRAIWTRISNRARTYGRHTDFQAEIHTLREYFSDVPWIALIVPSGEDRAIDNILTDRRLLRHIVSEHLEERGLVLQLEEAPQGEVYLENVFPAFKVALAEFTRWPGLLIWIPNGDAIFVELTKEHDRLLDRIRWVFSWLNDAVSIPDLESLKTEFDQRFRLRPRPDTRSHILHLSDVHLGSRTARRRMSGVQRILRSLTNELGDNERIIPVITGDLMDTPSDENLGDVRTFLDFIQTLGLEDPVITLGNHDVRSDGWLSPKLRQAINLPQSGVRWVDDAKIVFACFNSVNGGHLATGWIGEQEMSSVGNKLDEYPDKSGYTLIAALHHHPIPVDIPKWYRRSWYEKFLGSRFERTEELQDSAAFLHWLKVRSASAVLHGHKHIPRFEMYENIAVIGCGSSVGKVDTDEQGLTYMSINVITVDHQRNSLSCRMRAERVPGAGLESIANHEIVLRASLQ